ncbi:NYN domain-containing protein [Thioclava sp. GXIMD4215]|uniref:NYN domain-containing protein n=1 Tax=Thioclava sp. GXIMD4215 TaxID=3131928 RepID=UPI0032486093
MLALCLISSLAALYLVLRVRNFRISKPPRQWQLRRKAPAPAPHRDLRGQKPILIDGSNVLHWRKNLPELTALQRVLARAKAAGYAPLVIFDANVGYKLSDHYMGPEELAPLLGLPPRRIQVVDSGLPADPEILRQATRLGAKIITNDRYRDWLDQFSHAKRKNVLIRGHFRGGRLVLSL